MTVASDRFAARQPELLRVGRHDVVRWQADGRTRLRPLAADPADPTEPAGPTDRLLAGVVFHTARCGSTLLAHLLAARQGTSVLDEPPAVNRILADPGLTATSRRSLLRRLVATCRVGPGRGAAVVLKCSSRNVLDAGVVLTAFPDTPVVFVLRDPLEVLVSLTERPPGWLVPEPGRSLSGAVFTPRSAPAPERPPDSSRREP